MSDFVLTQADRNSGLWLRMKKHLKAERESLRARNDNALDPVQTATLRGRVAALNDLIALDEPAPGVES